MFPHSLAIGMLCAVAQLADGGEMPLPQERLQALSAFAPQLQHSLLLESSRQEAAWGFRLVLDREELGQRRKVALRANSLPRGVRLEVYVLRENGAPAPAAQPLATFNQPKEIQTELYVRGGDGVYVLARRESPQSAAAPARVALTVQSVDPLFYLWTEPDPNRPFCHRFEVRTANPLALEHLVCRWRYGDGVEQQRPLLSCQLHTYPQPGEYRVVVEVSDPASGLVVGLPSATITVGD